MTILFADVVGFSSLAEHLDPEELKALMNRTLASLTAEVEGRGGMVEKFIGDAIVAIFGVPVAHEDDPLRALRAAVAMLEVVEGEPSATEEPLSLRIGINSGLVVSGAVGDGTQAGVMGDAVNVAARLQQAADPGEIVVSGLVWRRVHDRFDTDAMGSLGVKGRERAVEAYRVLGERDADPRRRTPFVGRRDELSLLELLWTSVEKGNTHVVSVVGEPGVGKSRLFSEFPRRDDAIDIRITCSAERPFGPFLDLIQEILGGLPGDVDALVERTATLGVDPETARLLAALLGLAGAPPVVRMADEQQRSLVFAGVWQFLVAAAGARPALVLLDDVHFADRASLDLLEFLLERLGGVPAMLILASRPGFDHMERSVLRASHTAIRLEPLIPEETVALARGFLDVDRLPADLERLVAGRSEGNPFFVEELLQALLELGSLALEDGTAVLARVDVEIPDTVQGTVLARVDMLDPAERTTLRHAAVLGRGFGGDLLRAVVGNGDAAAALEGLSRAQLLVSQGPDRWAFKHALIQEVVYDTLLRRQRREMHARVAQALEQGGSEDDPVVLRQLAEHYASAEVPEKARRYAVAAGDLARDRMGFVEAKSLYESALRVWGEGDPEGRLELLMKLGRAATHAGDASSARTALVEAEAGWRALGDMKRAGGALAILGRVLWAAGESDRGAESLARAIELLGPLGPTPELVEAHVWASTAAMLAGREDEATALATRGLELEVGLGLDGDRSQLLNNLGTSSVMIGEPSGIDRLREALELGKRSGDAEAEGRAYTNLSATLAIFFRYRECVDVAEAGVEHGRRVGAPAAQWFIATNLADALSELGRYEEAASLCREILHDHRDEIHVAGQVNVLMTLSKLLTRVGDLDEARRLMDEAVPKARGLGGAEFLAGALLPEAVLEFARGNLATARGSMLEARDIVLGTPSLSHSLDLVADAARILSEEEVAPLLARAAPGRDVDPSFDARLSEAEGLLSDDRELLRTAADIYETFGLPFQEARARIDAGDLDRAAELVERFGLGDGPLGQRLRGAPARGSG